MFTIKTYKHMSRSCLFHFNTYWMRSCISSFDHSNSQNSILFPKPQLQHTHGSSLIVHTNLDWSLTFYNKLGQSPQQTHVHAQNLKYFMFIILANDGFFMLKYGIFNCANAFHSRFASPHCPSTFFNSLFFFRSHCSQ